MIKFILYEDDKYLLKKNHKLINKLMMKYNDDYRVFEFQEYNEKIEREIENIKDRKIYILDIEISNISGIDLARKIRKNDWNSSIIILTAHYELAFEVFKNRLLLLDFISKFNDYEKRLIESLKIALNVANKKNVLTFNFERMKCKVKYENIIYITKGKESRKTKIKTSYAEFIFNKSLKAIYIDLDDDFLRVNRNNIINKKYIDFYEKESRKLYLKNKEIIENISNENLLKEYSYAE